VMLQGHYNAKPPPLGRGFVLKIFFGNTVLNGL
jgi:hypothetical protein